MNARLNRLDGIEFRLVAWAGSHRGRTRRPDRVEPAVRHHAAARRRARRTSTATGDGRRRHRRGRGARRGRAPRAGRDRAAARQLGVPAIGPTTSRTASSARQGGPRNPAWSTGSSSESGRIERVRRDVDPRRRHEARKPRVRVAPRRLARRLRRARRRVGRSGYLLLRRPADGAARPARPRRAPARPARRDAGGSARTSRPGRAPTGSPRSTTPRCARSASTAEDVTEERHHWPGADQPTVILLRQGGGFGRVVDAGTGLAALVGAADGELPLGVLSDAIAELLDADAAELWDELRAAVRELVAGGMLRPVDDPRREPTAPTAADPVRGESHGRRGYSRARHRKRAHARQPPLRFALRGARRALRRGCRDAPPRVPARAAPRPPRHGGDAARFHAVQAAGSSSAPRRRGPRSTAASGPPRRRRCAARAVGARRRRGPVATRGRWPAPTGTPAACRASGTSISSASGRAAASRSRTRTTRRSCAARPATSATCSPTRSPRRTARALATLGIAYTVWHDLATDAAGPGLPPKLDHLVLGPTGLIAIQSEDWAARSRSSAASSSARRSPANGRSALAARAKAIGRAARVEPTALVVVVPDEYAAVPLETAASGAGAVVVLVRRSRLASAVREGIRVAAARRRGGDGGALAAPGDRALRLSDGLRAPPVCGTRRWRDGHSRRRRAHRGLHRVRDGIAVVVPRRATSGAPARGGRVRPPRRGRCVADRAGPPRGGARRRGDRLGAARGRRPDDALPHRGRAHRLPVVQAKPSTSSGAAGLLAGERRGVRRTAAQLVARPRAAAGRVGSSRATARRTSSHRSAAAHPAARDPPRPRSEQRRAHARQAAARAAGLGRRGRSRARTSWRTSPGLAGVDPTRSPATTCTSPTPRRPRRFGRGDVFFASGRMDNLDSVHAGLTALLAAPADAGHVSVLAAFDHEEIGSSRARARAGRSSRTCSRASAPGLGAGVDGAPRAFAASWLRLERRGPRRAPELPRAARPGEPALARRRPAAQAQRQPALRDGCGGLGALGARRAARRA